MKRVWKGILVLIVCFIVLNLVWMIWREIKYSRFTDGMEKTVFSQLLVPRFACKDEEGYDYFVKYPDYLSLTGNLGVGEPEKVDCLLIWPLVGGGFEYGVLVEHDGVQYQIYVDGNGNAVEKADEEIVWMCSSEIDNFFEKARQKWNLE